MKKTGLSIAPALFWLIISFYLLTMPGTKFPKDDWLNKIWIDKWVHIILFGVLVWLWCLAVPSKTKKIFFTIGILCTLYGIGMEFVQKYFVAFRSFDVGDIIADAVGSAIGVYICTRRYIKK